MAWTVFHSILLETKTITSLNVLSALQKLSF